MSKYDVPFEYAQALLEYLTGKYSRLSEWLLFDADKILVLHTPSFRNIGLIHQRPITQAAGLYKTDDVLFELFSRMTNCVVARTNNGKLTIAPKDQEQ